MRLTWLVVCSLLYALNAVAAVEVHRFENAADEQRYRHLTEELRCLVCQNQNLAESDADLAKDLREEIYEKIEAGQSNRQIIDFMVARYGDFVLYKPPFKPITALLWLGPFLILGVGVVVLLLYVRRRRNAPAQTSAAELARARRLLESSESSDNS